MKYGIDLLHEIHSDEKKLKVETWMYVINEKETSLQVRKIEVNINYVVLTFES